MSFSYALLTGDAPHCEIELCRSSDGGQGRRGLDPGARVILHPGERVSDGVRIAARD